MSEGKQLSQKIKGLKKNLDEVANALGISRATLYNHTQKAILKDDFKKLLFEKLNIQISENVSTDVQDALEKRVERLESEIDFMRKFLLKKDS